MAHIVRIHVNQPLAAGQTLELDRDVANRLFNVMRLTEGDELRVFNGQDGEWRARVARAGKRAGVLSLEDKTAEVRRPPDLWLLFAPIKKDRTDFIVEKAAELGTTRICPVLTDFTNSERVRVDRLEAHVVAAVEQCGGTYVPDVTAPQKLSQVLDAWAEDRQLIFCDEMAEGGEIPTNDSPAAIVIGPEGGFSQAERNRLARMATTISLGPRILRADTAAVAALTLWQATNGDWR